MFVGDRQRRAIERFLKPIKVTLVHHQGQRVRPILGVEWRTPSQVMFVPNRQDEEMSGGIPEGRNREISVQVSDYTPRTSQWLELINGISDIPQTNLQLDSRAP